ncbi:17950_t:CDS:2, partial [Funneliformis geosporum]
MEIKNMWQQATITFVEDANFKGLKNCYGLFVLNDMVHDRQITQGNWENDDIEATLSNDNLTIDGKHIIWTDSKAKLYAICSFPNHKANDCPRRKKSLQIETYKIFIRDSNRRNTLTT